MMARTRYIQDPVTHKLIPAEEYYSSPTVEAPRVLGDIQPYKSMITGEMITSRSKHREHLRQHGMIEVGNEVNYMMKNHENSRKREQQESFKRLKETVIRNVNEKLR